MSDPTTRAAARWATLIALPLTLIAGYGGYLALRPATATTVAAPRTPGPVPQTPVTMAAPALPAASRPFCRDLLQQAPRQLRDLLRRRVTAGPDQNLAYGEPPITMSCGVPAVTFPPTDTVYPLDGICWHRRETPTGTSWTTVDRRVPVQITLPAVYTKSSGDNPLLGAWMNDAQWVIDFSAPVVGAIPAAADNTVPAGCRAN